MTLGITLEVELLTSYNPILRLNAIHLLNIHEELESLHHDKRRGRSADYINVFQFPLSTNVAFQMDGGETVT